MSRHCSYFIRDSTLDSFLRTQGSLPPGPSGGLLHRKLTRSVYSPKCTHLPRRLRSGPCRTRFCVSILSRSIGDPCAPWDNPTPDDATPSPDLFLPEVGSESGNKSFDTPPNSPKHSEIVSTPILVPKSFTPGTGRRNPSRPLNLYV